MEQIKIGVSRCLLGDNVRYDGGHQLDRFIRDTLGRYVTFVPVCPEVECGLPVPREAMRLVGKPEHPSLRTNRTDQDLTEQMLNWAARRVVELEAEGLCGFIFKNGSPSSGMERVKVYNEKGMPEKKGVGLFARAFMNHFPLLPVEEDGRLNDPVLREHFIENIFAMKRLRELLQEKPSRNALETFHARHKLLLLARSPVLSRELGRVAAKKGEIQTLYDEYGRVFQSALKLKATVKKHVNVLQHIMGYFKKNLTTDEKMEVLELLEAYRLGYAPLIAPVVLLNHFVRKYDQPYLKNQHYLNPHPVELGLRNHV